MAGECRYCEHMHLHGSTTMDYSRDGSIWDVDVYSDRCGMFDSRDDGCAHVPASSQVGQSRLAAPEIQDLLRYAITWGYY